MVRLSIVIPTVRGVDPLEAGLVSVLQHRPADSEVVVVLTESYADPYQLREEVTFVHAPRGASRAECLNYGLAASTGEIVHHLDAGLEVDEDWASRGIERFVDPDVAAVVPVVVEQTTEATTATAGIVYHSGGGVRAVELESDFSLPATQPLGPQLRAGFVRREVLADCGGWADDLGEHADADLALRIAQPGLRIAVEPRSRIYCRREESGESAFRQGLHAERLFWRHFGKTGKLKSFALHPGSVLGDCLRAGSPLAVAANLAGRACGLLTVAAHRQERRTVLQPIAAVPRRAEPSPAHEASADQTTRSPDGRKSAA